LWHIHLEHHSRSRPIEPKEPTQSMSLRCCDDPRQAVHVISAKGVFPRLWCGVPVGSGVPNHVDAINPKVDVQLICMPRSVSQWPSSKDSVYTLSCQHVITRRFPCGGSCTIGRWRPTVSEP